MTVWYINKDTNGAIWSLGLAGVRHFSEMNPVLSGAVTYCGIPSVNEDESDIVNTCSECSQIACQNKFNPPLDLSEPDGTIS